MTEPLPCPFCGHVGLSHHEGSTFRWLVTECNGCGAQCGEERINTMTMERSAAFEQAKEAAIKTWNTRAAQPEQEPVAWYHDDFDTLELSRVQRVGWKPLYTTPPAAPVQEPVAWAVQGTTQMIRGEFAELDAKSKAKRIGGTCVAYPLYTAPPQRSWVGLTDEEKKKIATVAGCTDDDDGHIVTEIFRLAEAKLKEKNHDL